MAPLECVLWVIVVSLDYLLHDEINLYGVIVTV